MEGLILFVGAGIGLVIGVSLKRMHILSTAPEADLIAEIKRRRVEERLTQEAKNSVAKDLEGL